MKLVIIAVLFQLTCAYALECGIAEGFPPYQFRQYQKSIGADVDLIGLFNRIGPVKVTISQDHWLKQLMKLKDDSGIDCFFGMEKSSDRQEQFLISRPIYFRYSAIFLAGDSKIQNVQDLAGKKVSGDLSSMIEAQLNEDLRDQIELIYPKSKSQAMRWLRDGKISAAIMPLAVGKYLSEKLKVSIRVLRISDIKVPVGVAVRRDQKELLVQINKQLAKAVEDPEYSRIIRKWKLRY